MVRIAVVAGEASGDILGASFIDALKKQYPDAEFFGIGGPEMIQAGCRSFYPIEQLSIMGLFEVLKHLPSLLKMRKQLFHKLIELKPDVFIGIDAPDFNLGLEKKLKQAGIKTVHYVSPSVWAWRQWRVKKISQSVDLMLTLFPFEVDFYKKNNVPAEFVGHPLASMIPMDPDKQDARLKLNLDTNGKIVALLPGSRRSEVERMSALFIETAIDCYKQDNTLEFVVPFATEKTREIFQRHLEASGILLPIKLVSGQSRTVMQASDYILLASGTATLEAMLLKKPMVVVYIMNGFTFWFLKKFRILKASLYSLPNVLAGEQLVEEYIQNDATRNNLVEAMMRLICKDNNKLLVSKYNEIHQSLIQDESNQAAHVVLEFLGECNRDE